MLWYVAIIAAVNLGLGYVWGAYFRRCPRCARTREMRANASAPLPAANTALDATAMPVVASAKSTVASGPAPTTLETVLAKSTTDSGVSRSGARVVAPRDPATGLVTREYVEQLLAELASEKRDGEPITLALVEMAPIEWAGEQHDKAVDERLLCGVSIIVRQSLAGDHTAARFSDQQFLLLVPHEDVEQATRRAEEMRQRVATTEFIVDGRAFQTTVTCALAQVAQGRSQPELLSFLKEALDEAKRYGGNRTFTHDGNSPTPVVPPDLAVAPKQLAI